jgi:YHS domain-containing protein
MKPFHLLAIAALSLFNPAARAEKPINTTLFGVAIKGFDPVAYFVEGKPRQGASNFTVEWQGATWRFANAQHRDAFKATPEQFAPQFGGYCAWAVSQNYTASTDPENAWKIVNGKAVPELQSRDPKKVGTRRTGQHRQGRSQLAQAAEKVALAATRDADRHPSLIFPSPRACRKCDRGGRVSPDRTPPAGSRFPAQVR